MVVKIKTGKSARGAINYNEQKVQSGNAELILASRFGGDIGLMGISEKIRRFNKITSLNEKSKTNTLHLSLNFPSDETIDTEMMQKIATEYMQRIGFGHQPYLVYQHKDTINPHIHIVAPTIRSNGSAIFLHNIGKNLSEPARRAIEQEYGLIQADSRKKNYVLVLQPLSLETGDQNLVETKRKISNTVLGVMSLYKFSSLDEMNTILGLCNVRASRGQSNSSMYLNRGLIFTLMSKDKNPFRIGLSVKASSIYGSPTLKNLERLFAKNAVRKAKHAKSIEKVINELIKESDKANTFELLLASRHISSHVINNKNGVVTGVHFLDHKNHAIFTSTELNLPVEKLSSLLQYSSEKITKRPSVTIATKSKDLLETSETLFHSPELLKSLLQAENLWDDISPEFLKRKKKRRNR